jgi:4-hydroxy-2-oxoheptanedioate aldolase
MGWSLGLVGGRQRGGAMPPEMTQARARVLAACKAAKISFLNAVNENNVEEMIREGVMVCAGNEAAAARGRKFSKRTMPW